MKTNVHLEEALEIMKQQAYVIEETEEISILHAAGRILGENIYAKYDQPSFEKSAMDGYAFHHEDSRKASISTPISLEVIDCVYAGGYSNKVIQKGQAIQIMTGACVPKGATCVIRQEDTNDNMDRLELYKGVKKGENICHKGEDYQEGEILAGAYEHLDPLRLALISSTGVHSLRVLRKIKVALLMSGDEIISAQTPLTKGKIYDSNFTYVYHRLQQMGYEVIGHAFVQDDVEEGVDVLQKFSTCADVILTTGGVSVGKRDMLHEILDRVQATKFFWRVQIKPGTPILFSMLKNIPIVSLSGNPFALIATFEVLARGLFAYMQQDKTQIPYCKQGTLMSDFKKVSEKRRLVRAIYTDGHVYIPNGMHASSALRSSIGCNCFIDVPAKSYGLHKKDQVSVWMVGGYYE